MKVRLCQADCATLSKYGPESFPGGRSQAQDCSDRPFGVRLEVDLPQFEDRDAESRQELSFSGVPCGGSELTRVNRASWVHPRVRVPEGAVDLQDSVTVGEEEVRDCPETSEMISKPVLREDVGPKDSQHFPNSFLQRRYSGDAPLGDGLTCGEPEFHFRALFAPVVVSGQAGQVPFLPPERLGGPSGGGDLIWLQNDPGHQPQAPTLVVASGGAEGSSGF